MPRQIGADLKLDKGVGGEELVEGSEGLEGGGAAAEAALAVAGGRQDASLKTEDGAGAQVGIHLPLDAEGHVAGAVLPLMILILVVQREIDFKLVLHSEALFVNVVGDEAGRATGVRCGGDDELVFGIGLFGDQSARQIEFAPRLVWIWAEFAQVGDDVVDRPRRKQPAKCRHDGGEATRRAAVNDDGFPRGVWFGGRSGALREIRKCVRVFELRAGLGSAFSQIAVTGDAAGLVDAFAIPGIGRLGIVERLRAEEQCADGESEANANERRERNAPTPLGGEAASRDARENHRRASRQQTEQASWCIRFCRLHMRNPETEYFKRSCPVI